MLAPMDILRCAALWAPEASSCSTPLATAAAAVVVCLCLYHLYHSSKRKGPRSWPLLGSSWEFISHSQHLHDYLTVFAARYKTFVAPYPIVNRIYTADPVVVEHILKTNFPNYGKGKWMFEVQKELFGSGIFSVDGQEWKQQRKTAVSEFSSKVLRQFSEFCFRDYATKLAIFLLHESKAHRPVEMQTMLQRMTLDSICRVGFGAEMGSLSLESNPEAIAFTEAFDYASTHIAVRSMDPAWKIKRFFGIGAEAMFKKQINVLNDFAFKMIRNRRQERADDQAFSRQAARPDLLSRFMVLCETQPEQHTVDRRLRDMALTFMLAGRDTVAITLCWFFYALHKNPQVEEKVAEEIIGIEGSCNSQFDAGEGSVPVDIEQIERFAKRLDSDTLSRLHYLHACLSETIRLYPAVPLDPKVALGDDVLPDGTKVRRGDIVSYLPYAMGRMEYNWGKDAMEFKPERWLKEGSFRPESAFKFTAFQAGPRVCMGKDFAYLQMKMSAAILLRFFKFELVPGHKVEYRIMLTLHMSRNGLLLNLLPRSSQLPQHKGL